MSLNDIDRDYRCPHKDAFFSLIPYNKKAELVVNAEDNHHLVSLSWKQKVESFDIGFHINSQKSTQTLATFGRNDCDIFLKPRSISRLQCSFEIDDLDTGIVMLYDWTLSQSTQVSAEKTSIAKPFETRRSPRKVLVHPGCNDVISMGGVKGDLIQFMVEWILDEDGIRNMARMHRDAIKGSPINPRKARTLDASDTVLPSAEMTPDEAFILPSKLEVRFFKQKLLGTGSFGRVWRVIGIDTGRVMAMKQFFIAPQPGQRDSVAKVHREVDLMRLAKHSNIADLITSQGWGETSSTIEIFMALEEGSVEDLSSTGNFVKSGRPQGCLHQMLLALDFLASQGIVHRDVKPDNILYSRPAGGPVYHFRLADFGVGKLERDAYSYQGTPWYMAPEILILRNHAGPNNQIGHRQSPKVDVWSLFVAIAYARDTCNYRQRNLNTNDQILTAVRDACEEPWMSKYSAMAIEDPLDRASAHDMLVNFFPEETKYEDNDVKIPEGDDEITMVHRPAQVAPVAQYAPLVSKQPRSLLQDPSSKVGKEKEKKKKKRRRRTPCNARSPLAQNL